MSDSKPTRPKTAHIPPFGLRLQPELKAKVEQAATENGRSINAEIVTRLEKSFEQNPTGETYITLEDMLDERAKAESEAIKKLTEAVAEQTFINNRAMTLLMKLYKPKSPEEEKLISDLLSKK